MAYSGAYHPKQPEPEAFTPPLQEQDGERAGEEKRQEPRRNSARPPRFDLGALFEKTEAAGMEADDLLMALILYLMYRESGDTDLLIMLGVMLLT